MATKSVSGKKKASSRKSSATQKEASGTKKATVKRPSTKKPSTARKSAGSGGRMVEVVIEEMRLRSPSGKKHVMVAHLTTPPTFIKPKRIHPRRMLPLIAEGEDTQLLSATPHTAFIEPHSMMAGAASLSAAAITDNLVLVRNSSLDSPGQQDTASNVGEPSVAAKDQTVFYTGNWYAAVSTDGGNTFQFIDPDQAFRSQDPPGSHFCCDQIVHYISKIDTFVWLLQYGPDTGDNIQRLAFAKTADVAQGRWRLFDITTKSLGVPGAFLDFPDLAVGENMLYITTNIFPAQGRPGAAVVRIPFSGIQSGQITAQRFVTMQLDSIRVAQNCGKTAFFATHVDTSTLRVFSWKESASAPTSKDLKVSRWVDGNGYPSRTPDGRRWLDRADARITGATLADKDLWFAWSVNRGGANQRPKPFVQIAKIDSTNMTVQDNINIWNPDYAIAYPALSTNSNNEVGITYMAGGGNRFPSHVVGLLTGTRRDAVVAEGARGPLADPETGKHEWGDYLTARRYYPNQKLFAAAGYTMQGAGDGSNRDCTPRFVLFGRSGEV